MPEIRVKEYKTLTWQQVCTKKMAESITLVQCSAVQYLLYSLPQNMKFLSHNVESGFDSLTTQKAAPNWITALPIRSRDTMTTFKNSLSVIVVLP